MSEGRTLVVTNDFPPRRGGIEQYVRDHCGSLPAGQVVVYTARMPGDLEYDARQPFRVYRDPAGTLLPTPAVARRVRRVFGEEGCSRVVFGAAAPLGLLGRTLRDAGASEIVAMTHGHEAWWARVPGTRGLLRRIAADADEITYVSRWSHDRIEPALRLADRAKLVHRPPTIDASRFVPGGGSEIRSRLGIALDALVVVCVARLVRRKGQDTLIRILPELVGTYPNVVLLLVGDGPERGRLERMVRRRGLGERVVFAGSVDPAEIPAHLDAADVFAMPCRTRKLGLEAEAFGIVYLEAAAMGLPIVGGASGGAPEAAAVPR
ncbi:MAG: glycosyltransferase family 4 protein [Nocardioidaceae bacterium]